MAQCRRRTRDRAADPAAGAAAGARPALGATRGAASHQEAGAAAGAARRRDARWRSSASSSARPAAMSTPRPLHDLPRPAPRRSMHRRGRGRRRSLGAGARRRHQRALPRARRHAVAARRRRPGDLNIDSAGRARRRAAASKEVILALNATVEGQTTAHYITDLLARPATSRSRGSPMACRSAASSTISTKARSRRRSGSARRF